MARRKAKSGPKGGKSASRDPGNPRASARATIVDIAHKLKLSATTVSRALRDQPGMTAETRRQVRAEARRLGYVRNAAAAALTAGRTHSIVYVVPNTSGRFPSLYHMEVLEGLVDEISQHGYTLTVVSERHLENLDHSVFDVFKQFRADGAVLLLLHSGEVPVPQTSFPHPVVVVNRIVEGIDADFVVADDEDGAYAATQHLISLGHRSIAHLAGPSDNFNTTRRRRGYERALSDAGIRVLNRLVVPVASISEEAGFQATEKLMQSRQDFTAVFSAVDLLALGAMRSFHSRGLSVPGDVSLMSFDDDSFAGVVKPPLSTVRKPRYEMGRAAARLLMNRIEGRETSRSVTSTMRTKLIVRSSAASPNFAGRKHVALSAK
ncbi:MAG: LacI family DNA-binding transcriptional regulator [Alphaproteobacteria bacterium]|nr:LacI family DNA-binding transcriptional regulator [Alphaproteobacteria bacterium]